MGDIVYELPFAGGVDQSTRVEHLDAAKAYSALYNVRQAAIGGASKRLGFDTEPALTLDGSIATGYRLFMSGDQPCIIDGSKVYVFSPTVGRWIPKGLVPEAACSLIDAPSLGTSTAYVRDLVYCNGYVVVSNQVTQVSSTDYHYATVFDAASGTIINTGGSSGGPRAIYSTTTIDACRLATYGKIVIAITLDYTVGAQKIVAHYLDTTSAATLATGWISIGTIASDTAVNPTPVGLGVGSYSDRVALAYANSSGGASQVTVKTLNTTGVLATTTVAAGITPAEDGIAVTDGGTTLWVIWNETTTVKAIGLDPTSLAITSTLSSVINASGGVTGVWVAPTTSGKAAVYATTGSDLWSHAIKTLAGGTVSDGSILTCVNAQIIGRPVYLASTARTYAPLASKNGEEVVLSDITADATGTATVMYCRPVAAPVDRGLVSVPQFRKQSRCALVSTSVIWFGFLTKKSGTTTGTTIAEFNFASTDRWSVATVNGSTYLGGGIQAVFDRERVFESNFLCRPPKVTTNTGSAGSVTLTTGRNYVATYEEIDAYGNWHVSGVSDPVNCGACTSNKVVITIPPLSITARGSSNGTGATSLRIAVWGTHDGGAAPYFRIGEVANDPQSNTLTVTDNTTEANFGTTALLYGTGDLPATDGSGEDHRAPPGLRHIVGYNGMVIGAEGPRLRYSSQPIDGEGQWFSPVFVQVIDEDITGIDILDGSLILFTERRIYVASGDPPSDNASSGGIGVPRRLSVDVGSTDGKTLSTSLGVFFRSDRGLMLLTRGLSVEYIGAQVKDDLASFPVVTTMALDTRGTLARISLAQSLDASGLASGTGRDLVFDLYLKRWITADRKTGTTPDQPSQDARMMFFGGIWRYSWLSASGTVYIERTPGGGSDFLDGSTWVSKTAITPWIHVAGPQGEQLVDQILLLAERVTDHDITISIAYDYAASFTETQTWTAAQLSTLAREWLVRGLTQTTSTAVRIQISDATPSSGTVGTGEGGTWVDLTLSGTAHRGPKRSSSAQRGG